jgi:two-component system, cell cycle sensor histidine kinase and response regulator CckA
MNRARVLIVEDEALVAADLEDSLVRLGYNVVGIADNATDALLLAQRAAPDLALLDIHIRGHVDGVGLAEQIDVPVVFVTAHADVGTLRRASKVAPFGYVLKPFDERELQATLEIALGRHRAEMRLRKLDGWLTTTLAVMDQGVIACDTNLRVTFINERGAELTGWSATEALGCPLRLVFDLVLDEGAQSVDTLVRELLANASRPRARRSTTGAQALKQKDGRLRSVEDSINLVRDESGVSSGIVVLLWDRSEHEQVEQQPSEAEVRLLDAQRLEGLGMLASGLAHQMNNLLTAILSNTLLCGMEVSSSSGRESIEAIEAAGRRAALLCNQVLTYATQTPGGAQLVSIDRVVEQAAQLLHAILPRSTQLKLEVLTSGVELRADPVLLRQLLITLVVNASDALLGRNGTLELQIKSVFQEAHSPSVGGAQVVLSPGPYLCLELTDTGAARDTGAGLTPLQAYFSTKRSRDRGLAAVQGIVSAHGGVLAASGQPGSAFTLSIYFPAHPGDAQREPAGGRSKCVLVADDDKSVRLMLIRMLQGLGFEVDAVETGQAAVEAVAREPERYVLVFLDLAMPRLGGVKAHEQIQALAPTLPVALMSGYHESAARQVLGHGFTTFLQKPFTRADLNRKLHEALGTVG